MMLNVVLDDLKSEIIICTLVVSFVILLFFEENFDILSTGIF